MRKSQWLSADLRKRIRGEVRFDPGSRALYATGGANWRQVPIGVVVPKDIEDVLATLELCHEHRAPVLARGGGTGLAGQTTNVAVVIDFSKYLNRLIAIDPTHHSAVVEPGIILDHLRHAAEKYHLTFGPDPSIHDHCTLGEMIGNNSCGTHSVMAGRTSENIDELEICTYSGLRMRVGATSEDELRTIIAKGGERGNIYRQLRDLRDRYAGLIRERYPKIPRRVSGYNLDELLPENRFNVARALVGTEGTCVTVLEARVRLVPSPPCRALVVLGYKDIYSAGDHAAEILNYHPIACEAIDETLVDNMRKKGLHSGDLHFLPKGRGWLLVEFGGDSRNEAADCAKKMLDALKSAPDVLESRLYDNSEQESLIWKMREAGLGATALVPGEPTTWEGWEDSAVPPDKLGKYLREFRKLLTQYGYRCALYGHFGQGCLHTRIEFDLKSHEGIQKYHSFTSSAADLVVSMGGSLSGEHGDGQSRASFLPKMFGNELVGAFGEFKSIWDPQGRMNPHKVVNPYTNIENLRLGENYHPRRVQTYFQFAEDGGDFAAALRCVGVGKCRRTEGGVMCPSFMATREEMHSTRGRAHLLFEMLQGDPLKDGWKSESVREALDLCLSCKGCKGECPVNVDMATYKAEFLAHYYRHRRRPLSAYSMGHIDRLARMASTMPSITNFALQAPMFGNLAKRIAGISRKRAMPPFARTTFRSWFLGRRPAVESGSSVILWPDTFNNYFHPEVAQAATEVLEAAGYRVKIPARVLCCGRPLYDFGFLKSARRYLRKILDELGPELRAGTFIIGLEPSCLSVLRDESFGLFPDDQDAYRLSRQAVTFSEFLENHATQFSPPVFGGRPALVQAHCHHRAVLGFKTEESLMKRMQIDFKEPEPGCCGMAGSFGFEPSHHDLSMKIAERSLLPAARSEDPNTLIIADGFSCRTQIQQGSGHRPMHIAEVVRSGIKEQKP